MIDFLLCFFKSYIWTVIIDIVAISGFIVSIIANHKVKQLKSTTINVRVLEYFLKRYRDFETTLNLHLLVPSDILKRIGDLNKQLYAHLDKKDVKTLEQKFDEIDKKNKNYDGLKAFVEVVIKTIEGTMHP